MTTPDQPKNKLMKIVDDGPKQPASTVLEVATLIMATELLYELRDYDPKLALKLAARLRKASETWVERAPESVQLVQLMAEYLARAESNDSR